MSISIQEVKFILSKIGLLFFVLFIYSLNILGHIKPVAAYELILPGNLSLTSKGGGYYDFAYSESGWSFTGSIFKPPGTSLPGIVISHGKGGSGYLFCAGTNIWFPEYLRICPNYTHASSAAGGNDDASSWAGSLENVRRATRALDIMVSQQLENQLGATADPKRLFMWGNSMGAMVTIATAAEVGERIQAAAYTAGGISTGSNYQPNDPAIAARIEAPILMLHALNDGTVSPDASRTLRDALISYDKTYQLVFFASGGHNMMHDPAYQPVLGQLMKAWFENPDPVLTSISPNSATAGSLITFTGSNFGTNLGNLSSVIFTKNKLGNISAWSANSIKASVPHDAISGLVKVVVPQGPVTDPLISSTEQPTGGKRSNGIYFTVGGHAPSNPLPSTEYATGDVNHDGKTDASDAKLILNNYAQNSVQVTNYFDAVVDSKVNNLDLGWVIRDW